MEAGYTVEYNISILGTENIIECINYKRMNHVSFYYWHDLISGSTENTVAIFKIKPKSK